MRRLLQPLFSPSERPARLALVLTLVSAVCLLALARERGSWSAVAGDESTFLAMAESLALDGDLRFAEADLERLKAADPPRRGVILQRAGERVAFSKPVLFPLAAAPFYRVSGRLGIVLLNGLALAAALGLFWRSVRERPDRGLWILTAATFAATGALLPQVAWAMGDALQVALALAGATLLLDVRQRARPWVATLAGGALLGALISMRLPNGLLVVAVLAAVWLGGRRAAAAAGAVASLAGLLLATLLNVALIGSASPYRAERATFNRATGFPAGPGGERALEQFVAGRATQTLTARPTVQPRTTLYSGLYFLFGRHTGLALYFPAALLLFWAAWRAADRAALALLFGVIALVLFYLIWMPQNYFGGASFVGNRYFLPAYALLLPALRRPPRAGSLLAVWGISATLFLAAWSSVSAEAGRPFSSQSHAYRGLFRLFPYESTALAIEDREDRYFSDEFVRFVDPNAQVSEHGFHLRAGAPPAELLLATHRPSGVLRFVAVADAPRAAIRYRDWRGEQRFELEENAEGARGVLEIVAGPAWRRHPFWWSGETLRAHSLRLELEAAAGSRAQLRYLGPYRLVSKFFDYEVLEVALPDAAEAGARETIVVRLRNRGRRPWSSDGDAPVHMGWRVAAETGADGGPSERTAFLALDGLTGAGEELLFQGQIEWPQDPGRYRVELDLVMAGTAWFQEWLGEPIARRVVEVSAAL